MRSHVSIQPLKPKTKIIKRVTVTQITQPLTSPLPPFPQKIPSHLDTTRYQNSRLPQHIQIPQSVHPHISPQHTQQQIHQNQLTTQSRNYHRGDPQINNRSVNLQVSRSGSKRNKIFTNFAHSKLTVDRSMYNSRMVQLNRSTTVYGELQRDDKNLKSTRARINQESRRNQTQINENLRIMPIEVFSCPNTLPEICCKMQHERY